MGEASAYDSVGCEVAAQNLCRFEACRQAAREAFVTGPRHRLCRDHDRRQLLGLKTQLITGYKARRIMSGRYSW